MIGKGWKGEYGVWQSRSEEIGGIGHGLEFEVIPGGIFEEHGPLLPHLPCEAKVGLDDEFGADGG